MSPARRAAVALLLLSSMLLSQPAAAADSFFHEGECEMGAFSVHAWHEFGHDLAAYTVGDQPPRLGALWGDKWNESLSDYPRVALGGLLMQLVLAGINAADEEPESHCAVAMNTVGSSAYALRSKLAPDFSGDYDPYSLGQRNTVAIASVVGALLLEGLADQPAMGASLFGELPPGPVLVSVPLGDGAIVEVPRVADTVAAAVPLSGEVLGDASVKPSMFSPAATPPASVVATYGLEEEDEILAALAPVVR